MFGMIKSVGHDALEELRQGIDKAWDEIRMGVEEGIETAGQGFQKAWSELADSIERAKDSVFMTQNQGQSESQAPDKINGRKSSGRIRKEKLS